MPARACVGLVCLIVLSPLVASAECPDDAAVRAFVSDFAAPRLSRGFGQNLSLADAECARGKVVKALRGVLGRPVGYKAAFTNPDPALMKRLGTDRPAWAVMFDKMLLKDGARVPAKYGAVPAYEVEIIAVVKDAAIVHAKTPLEALRYISDVQPYIELVDRILGDVTAHELIATNIAFRGGVLGPRTAVEPTQAFLDTLGDMTVVVTEHAGGTAKETGRARGSALMGHPMNVLLGLVQALTKDGVTLKPGDLLDLGGFFPPVTPRASTNVTVSYLGISGNPSVTVHFD
jgi:2-oxo-hept-3-ene-1,7-dioate hydratase